MTNGFSLTIVCQLGGRWSFEKGLRINLPVFSNVVPAIILMFLSCRPFVAITTLSTGLVGVEVFAPIGAKT